MEAPHASVQISPARSSGVVLVPFLLVAATILALWPVCTAEFTTWDDPSAIAANPTMLPPTWHSVAQWWTKPAGDLWIPVTYTTWGLLALMAEQHGAAGPSLNPHVFHTANLLLHVLASLVVFELLRLLIGERPTPSPGTPGEGGGGGESLVRRGKTPTLTLPRGTRGGDRNWPAAAGAALFALHPVQVEPVAWAAGMKDILFGLLALVALWQYLLSAPPPIRAGVYDSGLQPRSRASRWHYAVATAAFALALLSKPTAVIVPIVAAVLECATEPRMYMRGFGPMQTARMKRMFLRLGLWLAMAIPITIVARDAQPIQRPIDIVPIAQRPVVAFDAIAFYVGKIVWPIRLCIDYGRTPAKIIENGQAYWTWIVPVVIAVLITVARRGAARLFPPLVLRGRAREGADSGLSQPSSAVKQTPTPALPRSTRGGGNAELSVLLPAGAAAFVLGLLPVLGLVGFDFQGISTVADHYLYVPMFGVALIAASLLALPGVSRRAPIAVGVVGIVLALLAYRSFALLWTWHDSQALYHHVLAVNPQSSTANEALCDLAITARDYPTAIADANAAVHANPRRPQAWAKLANAYTAAGKTDKAIEAMQQAKMLDPSDPRVLIGLGLKYVNAGQLRRAADQFRQAIRIDPDNASAEILLGVALSQMGRVDEGFSHVQRAVHLAPDNSRAQVVLGDFLREMGRPAEAKAAYESALRLEPGYQEAIKGLRQLAGGAATQP